MKPLLVASLALLVLAGCSPTPGPRPVAVDAGPLPSSAEVCLQLAAIGCYEGAEPSCQRKIDQAAADRMTIFPLRCWAAAKDRDAARACGQLTCPEPEPGP